MENTCSKIIETFNTNILDEQSVMIQAAFLSLAKEAQGKNDLDNTLFRLVRNHYDLKKVRIHKPVSPYIGGPFHLTKHINKNTNMIIYIFGERHSDKVDCPLNYELIENYLYELIQNTDVFLDLYFEFPGFTNNIYSRTNIMAPQRMQDLFLKFYDCIQTLTRTSDKCQLSRIHYIDTRSSDLLSITSDLLVFSHLYRNGIEYLKMYLKDNSNKNFIKKIINQIPSTNINEYNNFWLVEFTKEKKIQKELNKSFYKNEIIKFIQQKIIDKLTELDGFNILKNLKRDISKNKFNHNLFLRNLEVFSVYVGNYIAVYIDAYSLSRIFKDFKITNNLNQPKRPKNIIIYAEDRHSQNYRDFIESIGFIKSEESSKFYENFELPSEGYGRFCTDMINIEQPFFNKFV
jgi:hypothetical protein